MKREFLVAVGGAAIVIAGLSGCSSSDKKDTSNDSTATATATASATASVEAGDAKATTGAGTARVSIDGKEHKVEGTVVCATVAGNVSLTAGQGMSAVTATVSEGDQPSVTAVGLGNIDGVTLGYTPGLPGGSAEATKDGNKYTIKGNATGMDGMNQVTKPFELEVACP
ncbi:MULTISPECIES: lipoprotein LpqH [Mycolicibacterium]|uniref:lipoprotein LpqH n=3 Tax=Mycolicibacterium TaxID=1866885 RepID=A0A378WAU0_9MYCO|nr:MULTISPECIES: lipoprotein LpqH [Mycolicibacterium]KLI05289.1 lipoprotein LpqH [Mycolicibacterium senegalense]KLO54941.1 lipoprotein LpqH [Mycolicibacterium senegalense]KMV15786.1 lipoprotein LpqH [Mycolicibacterium conceptionense]MCV7337305.1 lipoprotein LpqH [Mycolicibacterium senegalense]MCW1821323.1 lipoprotein LpqH [Mycolicibacterium senegalense]